MKPEIRDRWVAALESGNYRQGKGALHRRMDDETADEYCCLGVLCELACESSVAMRVESPDTAGVTFYDDSASYLPDAVMEWAGLVDITPWVVVDGRKTDLSTLNDAGATFQEIADVIRRSL